jgi:coenzyme PQQ precursor peptide PqqA
VILWGLPGLARTIISWRKNMTWTKPEIEVVEVTMEVTAYVARR